MVFCYQNCSDLLSEKIVLVIKKNLQKFWDNKNNFFKQWKVRTIFGNRMLFYLVPGGFSDLKNWNNYNWNWKKLLGFRKMQAKLEKIDNNINKKRKTTRYSTTRPLLFLIFCGCLMPSWFSGLENVPCCSLSDLLFSEHLIWKAWLMRCWCSLMIKQGQCSKDPWDW